MGRPRSNRDIEVWRVRGLRGLELRRGDAQAVSSTRHLHAEFEITIVERGAARIHHRGSSQVAVAGALIVVPPGESHMHDAAADGTTYRSFFPDLASVRDASSSVPRIETGTPSFRETVIRDDDLAGRVMRLHRLLQRAGSPLTRDTLAVEAATFLVTRHGRVADAGDWERPETGPVARARNYLHDHVESNVSLADLAEVARMPALGLVRAFTRRVGMPPHAYHVQLRVSRAKAMLSRGVPPASAAVGAGFVDQSHLTRHFRRAVGVTPGAFARAVLP